MLSYPKIDPVIFTLGPFEFRWYGFMYVAGIFTGYWIAKPYLQKLFKNAEAIGNYITALILGILIGGRLGYTLVYDPQYYLQHPLSVFAVWEGGMSYHGGALGCIIATLWAAKRYKIPTYALLDIVATVAPIGIGLGRIANFINSELFGRVTKVSWGMVFPTGGPLPRHPSQLYESFFEGVVMFVILYPLLKSGKLKNGHIFYVYMLLYGTIRFFIEFFREPDPQIGLFWGFMSLGQLLCLGMIFAGLTGSAIVRLSAALNAK